MQAGVCKLEFGELYLTQEPPEFLARGVVVNFASLPVKAEPAVGLKRSWGLANGFCRSFGSPQGLPPSCLRGSPTARGGRTVLQNGGHA
eukprot:392041-Karenia_brevis.AAC.1